ncbi:MAG: hypothetical protein ACKVW3_06860 [Phycisphaerales bacterium]
MRCQLSPRERVAVLHRICSALLGEVVEKQPELALARWRDGLQ